MGNTSDALHPVEISVIEEIDVRDNPVIFDVGAHVGTFSSYCLEKWPGAKISCFEPDPSSANSIRNRLKDQVTLHQVALSNKEGQDSLYFNSPSNLTASLYWQLGGNLSINVQTKKLSSYLSDDLCVDYLKIDAEGSEYQILLGAESFLNPEHIKNIHFEFNVSNLITGVFVKDFWDLLLPLGYELSLAMDFTPIKEYTSELEGAGHREFLAR